MQSNETASEVIATGFGNIFGILTTPFILEASVAFFGLIAVMTYNQWRINRDGDGWVEMPVETEAPPAAAKEESRS